MGTKKHTSASLPMHKLLSLGDAALVLGLTRSSLQRRILSGKIPTIRYGRRVLVPRESLEQYLGIPTDDARPPQPSEVAKGQYLQLMIEQDKRCAICSKRKELLYVDHDHVTGVVRGLLCNKCNSGLGLFQDNPQLLKAAVAYLFDDRVASRGWLYRTPPSIAQRKRRAQGAGTVYASAAGGWRGKVTSNGKTVCVGARTEREAWERLAQRATAELNHTIQMPTW